VGFPFEELRGLIVHCSGQVPATWEDRPAGFQPGVRILLSVGNSDQLGLDDEAVSEFDDATLTRKVTTLARRRVRVNVRVDSFDPARHPLDVAERVRVRLGWESSRAALVAARLTYISTEPIAVVPWFVDGRQASSAILPLILYFFDSDVQTDNDGGVIETADVSDTHTV
jgi:hypothetical protein